MEGVEKKTPTIAFYFREINLCGAVKQTREVVAELQKRGYNSYITKEEPRADIIVANFWQDLPYLEQFPGRKVQWVRTRDPYFNSKATRNRPGWEVIANSHYSGDWIGLPYTIIPNGLTEEWFNQPPRERDIDILIEGNDEKNKRIPETLKKAREISENVVWLTRQDSGRVDCKKIIKPDNLPEVYQRSKVLLKLSDSEGFSNPCLEAMASGCVLVTQDMGGNTFCVNGFNCYKTPKGDKKILLNNALKETNLQKNALETAKKFTIQNTVDLFEEWLNNEKSIL